MRVVTREPARKNEARRPLRVGEKAPQALESRRACYGQPFSGLRERAQKMAAVAPSSGKDKKQLRLFDKRSCSW